MGLIPKHLWVWKVPEKNGRVLRPPEKRQKDAGFSALNSDSAGQPHMEGWSACQAPAGREGSQFPAGSTQGTLCSRGEGIE